MTVAEDFGTYGVWRPGAQLDGAFATRVEQLGYGTLWVGGSPAADLRIVEELLEATERIVIATGIVNVWTADAAEVARSFHRIESAHPGRFVLGIGSGHREATPERARPLATMKEYLDVLDAEGVPTDRRLLAALGERTLALAAERSLGAHPYLMLPPHTRYAREQLGSALLAPEQKVVLAEDAEQARAIAREMLAMYFGLSNYVDSLIDFGVAEEEFADGGSDELIDALAANPTVTVAATAVRAHLDAGADHVAVQALGPDPLGALEQLAGGLEIA